MRLAKSASRLMLTAFALGGAVSFAAAGDLPSGPLQPPWQVEILETLAARNDTTCGSATFYPWFAGMLASPNFRTTPPAERLETLAGLFGTERARIAFRSAAKDMAFLAAKETQAVPFPDGAPSRPLCIPGRLKPGETLIDYSRPYRVGDLVFIEQTIGSSNSTDVGILVLEKASDGEWRVADVALGPISD